MPGPTGASGTGQVGSVSPGLGLSGVGATTAAGSLGNVHLIPLTGVQATGAVGTFFVGIPPVLDVCDTSVLDLTPDRTVADSRADRTVADLTHDYTVEDICP